MIHAKKSIIMGFYRCGVSFKKIAEVMWLDIREVYEVVGNYLNTGKHE